MKEIMIIEDNLYKKSEIESALRKSFSEEILIHYFSYRNAALKFLRNSNIDSINLIILDWNIPIYQESYPISGLGNDILRELNRQDLNIPVIICSSEKVNYNGNYKYLLGSIEYDMSVVLNFDELLEN